MKTSIDQFLSRLTPDQKELWNECLGDFSSELDFSNNVTGAFSQSCHEPGRRPFFINWNDFTITTSIKKGEDLSIFGTMKSNRGDSGIYTIDLLISKNLFQLTMGGGLVPYSANLDDINSISYRMSENSVIIRATRIVSPFNKFCVLGGSFAAQFA